MSIELVNSANAHSAWSAMSIPQCRVQPRVMSWGERGAGMTWRVMRRRSPGIVGERQRPTGRLAVRRRILHPLVDIAPTIWTQAPTGHLFNYPKKLIGDVEGRGSNIWNHWQVSKPPGGTALLLTTFGVIVPSPCRGCKRHLFHHPKKFV
ncbi:hypothetical protein QA639_16820 [Bradyrhizobium pachyrhizi]|uniref:hypothetical protein n=1 Tax=Bradyrhizobium pachyrhizi TaxID=280333 RepID=UPI0024B1B66F|nr:hypothetical protein [Bradyrhizobium pachyrhizi]WFU59068.1 hypothetical protein QA639_16820 [Bradyrhizobium pachyrhizi]